LQSYLAAQPIARIAAELPDTSATRGLLVRGIAATISDEMARRVSSSVER
jgi:hypothetical protein